MKKSHTSPCAFPIEIGQFRGTRRIASCVEGPGCARVPLISGVGSSGPGCVDVLDWARPEFSGVGLIPPEFSGMEVPACKWLLWIGLWQILVPETFRT